MSNHEYNLRLTHLLDGYRKLGVNALALVNNNPEPPDHFILWFKPRKDVTQQAEGTYEQHKAHLDGFTSS